MIPIPGTQKISLFDHPSWLDILQFEGVWTEANQQKGIFFDHNLNDVQNWATANGCEFSEFLKLILLFNVLK